MLKWAVHEKKHPCAEVEKESTKSDSCFTAFYVKILETSNYRGGELDGLYELKDKSVNIVLKGYYINGIKDGGWVEGEFEDDLSQT